MVGLISKSYWDSLPSDVQAALKKAAVEACSFGQNLVVRMDADGLKYGEQNKMTVYTFPEDVRATFLEAVKPVYDRFVPDIDAEFYSLLTATQK